jgi:hypothetical protein
MSVKPSVVLDETSPAGSQSILLGDNRIREFKTQVREILEVDHDFPSSGQTETAGQHKQVTLQEQADIGSGAEGVPILGAQTIDDKPELVYTDEDDNDIQLTKAGEFYPGPTPTLATWSTIMNLVYPIGSVVTLGVSTDPATLFGIGTWTEIEGKVIVGISNEAGDEAFDTLNETGGVQTVTLTAAQSGLPAHTHPINYSSPSNVTGDGFDDAAGSGTKNSNQNTPQNASESHTNLQPYIVKYVWERTA